MRAARSLAAAALWACLGLAAETIQIEADSVSSVIAKGKERTVLSGNAVCVIGDARISADRIELYGPDNRYAACTGKVRFVDTKKGIAVSTERLDYDRQAKLSRMSGPTVMEDKRNKVVIKGSYIEDDGQSEITVIQVGVRILKEDMACRAEYAYYRRKENILELSGLPVIVKGNDEYRASRISVDMDSEEITLDGNVKGKVIQEGKSPSPSPSPSSAPSTASASALPSPDPSASPSFSPASPPPVEMGAVP